MPVWEILNNVSCVAMAQPVVTIEERKMGFKFMAAEAHWILSGDNRVENIVPYAQGIGRFSDDGYRFQGAYGPKVTEQLRYVVESLVADRDTRQAVLTIWRENPRPSKDIPCTISLQFIIRDGMIHTIANMRSSDLWLGWVYDVFNFTMITAWVALRYRERLAEINPNAPLPTPAPKLGKLFLNAGSQHIYEHNVDACRQIIHDSKAWSYKSMCLSEFDSPSHLMSHLVALRDRDWANVVHLKELEQHV